MKYVVYSQKKVWWQVLQRAPMQMLWAVADDRSGCFRGSVIWQNCTRSELLLENTVATACCHIQGFGYRSGNLVTIGNRVSWAPTVSRVTEQKIPILFEIFEFEHEN
jgi:hypothetical protein